MHSKVTAGRYKIILGAIISALMITSVLAVLPLASGSHTADVDVTPKDVKGDSRILFKISVNNTSASPDNIDMVWVSSPAFDEPIGGAASGENLENAADNLTNASGLLEDASTYLSDAASYKLSAGSSIADMEDDFQDAWAYLAGTGYGTAGAKFSAVSHYVQRAGDELNSEPENIDYAVNQLNSAALLMDDAADNFGTADWENQTRENLKVSASYLENAADNLGAGNFENAYLYLRLSADALDNAGNAMKGSGDANVEAAGDALIIAAEDENSSASSLEDAFGSLVLAGEMLGDSTLTPYENAGTEVNQAGLFLENITTVENAGENLKAAGGFLADAGMYLKGSGTAQDVFSAGQFVWDAAVALDNAGKILMRALGGHHLKKVGSDPGYLLSAGDNMRSTGMLDLTTASSSLSDAATHLGLAADVMGSAGTDLKDTPTGWTFDPSTPAWSTGVGENTLAPGQSDTFPIILRTGGTGENSFTVYTNDTAGATDHYTFTISVDNSVPSLTGRVYQPEVGENNVVGNVYNEGMANLEIIASEELSSIGDVKVLENGENVMPPLSLETADNITFTAEFEVIEWDDNNMAIWVESATDTYGWENTSTDNVVYFEVDTRAPTWSSTTNTNDNSGLSDARNSLSKQITDRAQTPENVWATDNKSWTVNGEISDNTTGSWSGLAKVEALVDESLVETGSLLDNIFSADDIDLGSEGVKTITIRGMDKTGNVLENSLENILFDASSPTIDVASMTPENGTYTNDNKIGLSVVVTDAGLGIDNATLRYDNVNGRWLDNADNFQASVTLENAEAWTGDAWSEDTHTIWVYADDGLNDNVTATWSFTIDVSPPDVDVDKLSLKRPDGTVAPSAVDEKTLTISGTADQAGSTVKVYDHEGRELDSVPLGKKKTKWSTEITLEDCYNEIYVEEIDRAGNTSDKVLFRGVTVDVDAPEISLSSETQALADTETGDSSVRIKATITDKCAEYKDIEVSLRSPQYDIPESYATLSPDGTIQVTMPLREGTNKIDIIAKDQVKNTAVESFIIKRTVTPWAVYAAIAAIIAIILAAIAVIRIERS